MLDPELPVEAELLQDFATYKRGDVIQLTTLREFYTAVTRKELFFVPGYSRGEPPKKVTKRSRKKKAAPAAEPQAEVEADGE